MVRDGAESEAAHCAEAFDDQLVLGPLAPISPGEGVVVPPALEQKLVLPRYPPSSAPPLD